MKSKKNILRFDYRETGYKGWRLSVTRAGTDLVKYFSDRDYGGMRRSYRAAEDARKQLDQLLESVPCGMPTSGKSPSSGVRGVHRAKTIGRKDEPARPAWVAAWTEKGRRRTRKFRVDKYGEEGAREMAIAARKRAEDACGLLRDPAEIQAKLTEAQRFLDSLERPGKEEKAEKATAEREERAGASAVESPAHLITQISHEGSEWRITGTTNLLSAISAGGGHGVPINAGSFD